MKQANLSVSFSPLQLSGELLLLFVLTTCNETSAPPHLLLSVQISFQGRRIIFTLTSSSRLRLTLQISFFSDMPAGCHSFPPSLMQLVFFYESSVIFIRPEH